MNSLKFAFISVKIYYVYEIPRCLICICLFWPFFTDNLKCNFVQEGNVALKPTIIAETVRVEHIYKAGTVETTEKTIVKTVHIL